jgi:hypothetical protein
MLLYAVRSLARRLPWNLLAGGGPSIKRVAQAALGKAWISLDSLVRIERFQMGYERISLNKKCKPLWRLKRTATQWPLLSEHVSVSFKDAITFSIVHKEIVVLRADFRRERLTIIPGRNGSWGRRRAY